MTTIARCLSGVTGLGIVVVGAVGPSAAYAQTARNVDIDVPAMTLGQALKLISQQTGIKIVFDPDAVSGLTSSPVNGPLTALKAVNKAINHANLYVRSDKDGSIIVTNDILVVAHRDEAETNVLVNQTSTSDRNGQSLREQPRNTEVISSKLIADQQDLNVLDALRNAGGVTIDTTNVEGGAGYSVRGFSTNGMSNGLEGTSSTGVPIGTTVSVAAVERVEVLKGPDAILSGSDNLGGVVNIVFKKPSADPLLMAQVDTGSYGLRRFTIDANGPLTSDDHLSARFIASTSAMDHNFGGYAGGYENFAMPELRFKNATTDIVAGVAFSKSVAGVTPYAMLDPDTNLPITLPINQPLLSPNQTIGQKSTEFFVNATQKITDWLDLVARFDHQHSSLDLSIYTVFTLLDPQTALLDNAENYQVGNSTAVDAFLRFKFKTFGIKHNLVLGYNYLNGSTTAYNASQENVFPYQFIDNPVPPAPFAVDDTLAYDSGSRQSGYYAQDLISLWKLHISAAVRRTDYATYGYLYYIDMAATPESKGATTPSFGVVLDIAPHISLFANYVRGFSPTLTAGFDGQKLPDIQTRNLEGGAKIDLFRNRLLITASYFDIRQSNVLVNDPFHPGYSLAEPGQLGKGIDIGVTGKILPNWTINANLTDTSYTELNTAFGPLVPGEPKIAYNVYTAYERKIAPETTTGISLGVFGRSSAPLDYQQYPNYAYYYVPAAIQVDTNAILKWHDVSVNFGIRNLFNRLNYGISYTATFVPYQEPRNWRLTVGYKFR